MRINQTRKNGVVSCTLILAATLVVAQTFAQSLDQAARPAHPTVPESLLQLKLASPQNITVVPTNARASNLLSPPARQQVVIRLQDKAVAERGERYPAAERAAKREIMSKQQGFVARCHHMDPSARVLARTQVVLNAVFMEADTSSLPEIAGDPEVADIVPVRDYELQLSETVPYVGATDVQARGFDGSGVKIAILDSGIDYTHAAFGGAGTVAAYEAAYGTGPSDMRNKKTDDLFPTARVVGGFDFVGEAWEGGEDSAPLAPDPDPIDAPGDAMPAGGHGTHVADIAGGSSGVAPGADLYALKVCSGLANRCSGVALIQAMDFAVDPNGDGDTSDAVDIINMSLGADYGQPFDNELALAVDNATALGVLTVAAAGNGADNPYVTTTPAAAPTAISVAQTSVPSASLPQMEITAPADVAGLYAAVFQPWSVPLANVIEAPVQYGDGAGGNLDGCAPFAPSSLTGRIVLVDRGACNFTSKLSNIGQAGGLVGVIGLVTAGAAFVGGDGGDRPIPIPGYMIRQADSNLIKSALSMGVIARFDPDAAIPLAGAIAASSARGPSNNFNAIKPDIGAPGALVSAVTASGTDTQAFSGTSGAAPMVAGSAALLMQAWPGRLPTEYKALLMNTGETGIIGDPLTETSAEITRIGGGEVRVDRALRSRVAAWDDETGSGSLSFGFVDVAETRRTMTRIVRLRNYTDEVQRYEITPMFRFADDAANGAVSIEVAPPNVLIPARADQLVMVTLTIDGNLLRGNFMNSGPEGANPTSLTTNEYDGYLQFSATDAPPLHMAWQVLPRKAAQVEPERASFANGGDRVPLQNLGVGTAHIDAYALIGESENRPEGGRGQQSPGPDLRAFGVNTFAAPAGFCSEEESFVWAFAINTWERQTHLFPVSHQVWLDTDQDGLTDFIVLNRDGSFTGASDGRQETWALDLSTGVANAFFFTEHATNTGNTVLFICGEQVGLTGTDVLSTRVDVEVLAQDFYFGGDADRIGPFTITPLGEQFVGMPADIVGNATAPIDILDLGPYPGNTEEAGLLLFTNGDRGAGARGGATQSTEVIILRRATGAT